jgi:hypothetical protein
MAVYRVEELRQAVEQGIRTTVIYNGKQNKQGMLFYRASINNLSITGKIIRID